MKTIIAAFCDDNSAQTAIRHLNSKGVTDAQLVAFDASGNVLTMLRSFNIPDDKAQIYAEVMRRGAPVVVARTEHDARELARDLDNMGSIDLDSAVRRWREAGWDGYDTGALPFDAAACATERAALMNEAAYSADAAGDRDLDVVGERVRIDKREVERGGVRVRTYVQQRPVEEQVQLTEERVNVSRERVDEPISPAAVDAVLTEDEFVVTARGEEAVVGKEARVVERVHVGKEAETRTETVQETEHRRDVQVEAIEPRTETRSEVERDRHR